MNERLVITGTGAVGPFGNSSADLWDALMNAQPLWRRSERLAGRPLSGEIVDFDLNRFRRTAKGHRVPRISQYALAAAAQAIAHAGLDDKRVDKDAVSIVFGTGNGPSEIVEKNLNAIVSSGLNAIEPLCFQESVFNAPASLISIEYGFRGPLLALPMGWAAGGHAVAVAADLLCFGHAAVAVVVVSDESASVGHQALRALGLVSPNDGLEESTRPFDARHNGAILSEGAAALIIETQAHAETRNAVPLMRLTGWGMASDSFGVGPKQAGSTGLRDAMEQALQFAGRERVDSVYSGSYCTADADRAEAGALVEIFGRGSTPPITNIRGVAGEAKSVSGILNVIAAGASMQTRMMPPTAGCESRDPRCDVDLVTAARSLPSLDSVLCNAFWVNGVNAAVVVESFK